MFLDVSAILRRMDGLDWERAGRALRRRRLALGYGRQEDAAAEGGIGVTTWRNIEKGVKATEGKRAGAERAVRWPIGTLEAIAGGADPPADQAVGRAGADLADQLDIARSIIDRVADRLREQQR